MLSESDEGIKDANPEEPGTWPAATQPNPGYLTQDDMGSNSPEISKFAQAFCKAQSEMGHAARNEENPFFKSSYADLASVLDVARGPLTKNGIMFTQSASTDGAKITVRTKLIHSRGEWMQSPGTSATAKDVDPQAVGSVITYLRRYSLSTMLCIATEDDDGERGQGRQPSNSQAKAQSKGGAAKGQAAKPKDATLSKKQVKDISAGFQPYQVGIGRLETKLGVTCDNWTEKERVQLVLLYKELEGGKAPDELFQTAEPGSDG